jgi:hypothetical protein
MTNLTDVAFPPAQGVSVRHNAETDADPYVKIKHPEHEVGPNAAAFD